MEGYEGRRYFMIGAAAENIECGDLVGSDAKGNLFRWTGAVIDKGEKTEGPPAAKSVHGTIKYAKVRGVRSPVRAHAGDAGIDFFVPYEVPEFWLRHGEAAKIASGIKIDVPFGWALVFMNKSGVASGKNVDVMACVVDHGYQGEVHLNVINNGEDYQRIGPGDKLLQGVLLPVGLHSPVEVAESVLFSEQSQRGEGGFGSTGK